MHVNQFEGQTLEVKVKCPGKIIYYKPLQNCKPIS